ncbi:glycogen debranching enzyme GlgX [candidate division KSB3 bacterium]|uniref:Glycogen debranching enzyme GlgX n=1 Tax=candidate division KSB3 bacterium TaxID=2044937 RepID=A0A2G6E206_9BACT|nr:MAG: glycogen debranching enzyme GlgX [candidate division KSB3 bacterium]PIE28808.1 MAG: glycogen debranching enzyme GlgX [candidate division KSB3 bacterium]
MERIDVYPTHSYKGFAIRLGRPYPFGASLVPGGVNFSIFSQHAVDCTLVLFEKGEPQPFVEIPYRGLFQKIGSEESPRLDLRIGNVFTMTVFELDYENIEYGFRMDGLGPNFDQQPSEMYKFDPAIILMDPYAKAIGGREVWGQIPDLDDIYPHRARLVHDDFDWESDRPLEIPIEDLVIYEMHVRGFTQDPSSGVKYPGTYAAIHEKIPYLQELGINCVELMPIFEFDELEIFFNSPDRETSLLNYWGYSTIGFFAPKAGYAATGKMKDGTMVADELKNVIKALHKNGIEVLLDVVFNHTGEGNENGPTISFRGIDNSTYYMLTPQGRYENYSGTGNTLNCNHPVVRNMLLDSLRYWAAEYHIDGFRFDLASILGRDQAGEPLANPPLLESLAHDPVLAKCKLIAEAWDAGGLYQVGSFPAYNRWAEWNGKYRDTVRRFLRGDPGQIGKMVQRVTGSPDLYAGRGASASINFITCHDGFTLADLVAYNEKHNEANGEQNQDGANANYSWNCGVEGATADPDILTLRRRQMKNAIAILLCSQGVPMLLMGDETGHSKQGNNNSYCHDNALNWMNWALLEQNADLFRFVKYCLAFRKSHPALRNRRHFRNEDYVDSGYPDISWHGVRPWQPDWSYESHSLAFLLCGKHAKNGSEHDDYSYVMMNMHWEDHDFELPILPKGMAWHCFLNTAMPSPEDVREPGSELRLSDQQRFLMSNRSVAVLVGR